MKNRPYGELRDIIERLGGSMIWHRAGFRYGAWIITLDGKTATIEATGERSIPELDHLYQPTSPNPTTWDDYSSDLIDHVEEKLLSLLR